MARSLSAWLRCFLALYPGRRNSIFLFLASILFLCFLSFFLAAMSGLATACKTEGERKYKLSSCSSVCVCALVVHHTCMALCRLRAARLCENSFWTAEKARENLCSPTCFFSSSISSCARFFSVGSGHGKRVQWNQCVGILKGYLTVFWSFFFFTDRFRAVTLVCVGAVQLPVQRSDDSGQIGAESLLPQVHGYRSQELKHTCSLKERAEGKMDFYNNQQLRAAVITRILNWSMERLLIAKHF